MDPLNTLPDVQADEQDNPQDTLPSLAETYPITDDHSQLEGFKAALIDRGVNEYANPDLDSSTNQYAGQVKAQGTEPVREQMARSVVADEDKAVTKGLFQPLDQEEMQLFMQGQVTGQAETLKRIDAYKKNISGEVVNQLNNLQLSSDDEGFDLRSAMNDAKDFTDTQASINRKRIRIQEALDTEMQRQGDSSFFKKSLDFVTSALPLTGTISAYNFGGLGAVFGDRADIIASQYQGLLNSSEQDLDKNIDSFIKNVNDTGSLISENGNYFRVMDIIGQAKASETTNDDTAYNLLNAGANLIDVATALPLKPLGLLARTGNKVFLAQAGTKVLESGTDTTLMKVKDAQDMLIRSAMNVSKTPKGLNQYMTIANDVKSQVLDGIKNQPVAGLLTTSEAEAAAVHTVNNYIDRLGDKFSVNLDLTDTNASTFRNTLGATLPSVDMYIGKGTGEGWLTKKAAEKAQAKLGFNKAETFFDEGSNEWFVKTNQAVDVNLRKIANLQTDKFAGSILKELASTGETLDDTVRRTSSINRGASENLTAYRSQLVDTIKSFKLSGDDKKALDEVWYKGTKEQTWYKPEKLRQMGLNEKQVATYDLLKFHNDLAYDLLNRSTYLERKSRGLEEVSLKTKALTLNDATGSTPARVLDNLDGIDEVNKLRLFDSETGKFAPRNQIENKLQQGGYKIVHFEGDGVLNGAGDPIGVALIKDKDLVRNPLSPIQVNYLAGGRVAYKDNWFVKQARVGQYSDDPTKKFVLSPKTFATSTSRTAGEQYVNEMNTALDAFKKIDANPRMKQAERIALEKTIHENTGWKYAQMQRMIKDGDLTTEPLELVFRDDLPKSVQVARRINPSLVDEGVETNNRQYFANFGLTDSIQARSRGYRFARGEALKNIDGNEAATLNVFESTDKTLGTAIRTGIWDAWRTRSVNSWFNTVQSTPGLGVQDLNAISVPKFMGITIGTGTNDPALRQVTKTLEQQRSDILRILNQKTDYQAGYEASVRKVFDFIEDKTNGKVQATAWDIYNKNPVNSLRGFAFHARLGLFNTTQTLLQSSQALLSTAIDPLNAPYGFFGSQFLMMGRRNPEAAKLYASRLSKAGLTIAEDYTTMLDEYMKSGFGRIGVTVQDLDDIGIGSMWKEKGLIGKGLSWGRTPFDLGEEISRGWSYGMAWQRVKQANPGIDMTSDIGRQLVNSESSKLSFNMSQEFAANANRGVWAIPMQFKTFMFRSAEMLLGKQLTNKEKASLLVGSALMFGADGVPGVDTAWQVYSDRDGANINKDVLSLMNSGLIDYGTSAILGEQTNFSSRAGLGQNFTDEFRRLGIMGDDSSAYSIAEFLGGPGGGMIPSSWGLIRDVATHLATEQGAFTDELIKQDLDKFAVQNIATWGAITKARWAYYNGLAVSVSNLAPIDKVNKIQSIGYLLGLPPQSEEDFGTALRVKKISNEEVDEVANSVLRLRREGLAVRETDPDTSVRKRQAAGQILMGYPFNERKQILDRVNSKFERERGFQGLAEGVLKAQPNAAINTSRQ